MPRLTREQIVQNEKAAQGRRKAFEAHTEQVLDILHSWPRSIIKPIPGNSENSMSRLGGEKVSHADERVRRKKIAPVVVAFIDGVDGVFGEVVEVAGEVKV